MDDFDIKVKREIFVKTAEVRVNRALKHYIHTWETGHQRLIFSSKEAAETWIKTQNERITSD